MRVIISLIISLTITATIGLIGYTINQNIKLRNLKNIANKNITKNEKLIKEIKNIKYINTQLQNKIYEKNKLIKQYQKINKNLAITNRNIKYKNNKNIQSYNYPIKKIYIKNTPNTYTKKIYKKKIKQYKQYQRYSRYEKLVSDSKIRRRKDGRFVSNSAIYGLYKYRLIGGISCGGNPNIYKVVNECKTYAPYSTNILYFRKSNINELRTFNPANHKIECLYNQKYGLMQDCKVKIFKFLY